VPHLPYQGVQEKRPPISQRGRFNVPPGSRASEARDIVMRCKFHSLVRNRQAAPAGERGRFVSQHKGQGVKLGHSRCRTSRSSTGKRLPRFGTEGAALSPAGRVWEATGHQLLRHTPYHGDVVKRPTKRRRGRFLCPVGTRNQGGTPFSAAQPMPTLIALPNCPQHQGMLVRSGIFFAFIWNRQSP
jgi:hypothetical protein